MKSPEISCYSDVNSSGSKVLYLNTSEHNTTACTSNISCDEKTDNSKIPSAQEAVSLTKGSSETKVTEMNKAAKPFFILMPRLIDIQILCPKLEKGLIECRNDPFFMGDEILSVLAKEMPFSGFEVHEFCKSLNVKRSYENFVTLKVNIMKSLSQPVNNRSRIHIFGRSPKYRRVSQIKRRKKPYAFKMFNLPSQTMNSSRIIRPNKNFRDYVVSHPVNMQIINDDTLRLSKNHTRKIRRKRKAGKGSSLYKKFMKEEYKRRSMISNRNFRSVWQKNVKNYDNVTSPFESVFLPEDPLVKLELNTVNISVDLPVPENYEFEQDMVTSIKNENVSNYVTLPFESVFLNDEAVPEHNPLNMECEMNPLIEVKSEENDMEYVTENKVMLENVNDQLWTLSNTNCWAKKHACSYCTKEFNTVFGLRKHMECHSYQTYCHLCNRRVKNRVRMRFHMNRHISGKSYKCKYCYKKFFEKSWLAIHTVMHGPPKIHTCHVCYQTFSSTCRYHQHLSKHTIQLGYDVAYMEPNSVNHGTNYSKTLDSIENIECDSTTVDSIENFKLDSATLDSIENMELDNTTPIETTELETTTVDSIENIELDGKDNLKGLYMKLGIINGRLFQGQYNCNTNCAKESIMNDCINSKKTLLRCSECEKKFYSRIKFECHRNWHLEQENIKIVANEGFSLQWNHSKKKLLRCSECEKKFYSKIKFECHRNWHLEQENIKIVGNGGFSLQWKHGFKINHDHTYWFNYKTLHKDGKRHCCRICNKKFNVEDLFMKHMIMHTNADGRYVCSICGEQFSHVHILNHHIEFHIDSERANEEDVDSPAPTGESNGNLSSCSSDGGSNIDGIQYFDLTLQSFWPKVTEEIRRIKVLDIRNQPLPLARIKKIMKLDDDVKMISAEAPMLFAKAAELFIMELTLRAWVHTEDNKRRTLQRSDIAMAITKYDQFDFLIDIVPREDARMSTSRVPDYCKPAVNSDQVHYYFQLQQQQNEGVQTCNAQNTNTTASVSTIPANPTTIQVIQAPGSGQLHLAQTQDQTNNSTNSNPTANIVTAASTGGQIIQLHNPTQQGGNANQMQFVQQIVTPSGEVQHIPFLLQVPVQQQQQQQQQRRK